MRGGKPTHGESKSVLYKVWAAMKGRCQRPTDAAYPHYGGRGITLCSEWQTYEPFRDWALANGYNPTLQIERINNDGPYSPNNAGGLLGQIRLVTGDRATSSRPSTKPKR